MVKRLVDTTRSGITGVSAKYGLPKSTVSEWLSILSLPPELQENIEKGRITTYEAIRIARKPRSVQERLVKAANDGRLQEEMADVGVKRGAPKGLQTVRLVFDPRKKQDKQLWDRLNERAQENGLDVTEYTRSILSRHIQ
jgi:ParB family chromosome partitioning protein